MKLFAKLTLSLLLVASVVACKDNTASGNDKTEEQAQESSSEKAEKTGQAFIKDDVSPPNVLDVAVESEDHTTLVKAVQAADLENSLVNAGPLMVFAPTNAAFDKLPDGTVQDLLKPENKAKLGYILKHHVTPGNYDKEFLKKFEKLGQASNENVPVTVKGDDVYIDGAKIIASIPASNGIIHVVDKVILPKQ